MDIPGGMLFLLLRKTRVGLGERGWKIWEGTGRSRGRGNYIHDVMYKK